ncbi:hypothetical protein CJ739_2427 [Mariniflexile rhizosphaerae]|uniref:hypothetical protein n=1 Tax=unclassified Mariniflexile TaxID=2643887 RepID=UPI000CAF4503|nr:hypothetical protein [Mariniflexile sp. TRM1-10]AXP81500.1 hypothetical protein CJ739_2427 [Mariniflexile sp. TRM1-10]PLB18418.1 MAG: hypothetical protein TRG1_2698 [Flavobacteriaceae bacterium FS1-H7996/R]
MEDHIDRKEFIKLSGLGLTSAFVSNIAFANNTFFSKGKMILDVNLMKKLITNNDIAVKAILDKIPDESHVIINNFRPLATAIATMSASISHSESVYYKSKRVAERLNQALDVLVKNQYHDGTLDAGGNRQSPPDTAFVLEYICEAAKVLHLYKQKELEGLRGKMKTFIVNAGEAMVTGGVHTPNHRWVISAALASINALYPDARYIRRIDEWLAEGIYLNADGHYLERSGVYSAVIDKAFITMARLLNKPELLDKVHANLITYYYYTETNGDLVTVDSRRQDQFMNIDVSKFYLQYRYMAIRTNNSIFAHMVHVIEGLPSFTTDILSHALVHFMANRELQKQIPLDANVENDFEKFFAVSDLARIRRGKTSVTLFGGNDKPVIVISGRSSNPNFLMYRKGDAILKYMRLSTSFFRMGYFSSDGLVKEGNKYIFKETKEANYYQPLAEEYRREDADYKLSRSQDGRFWNKMDFDSRTKSNVKTQISVIEITENNGKLSMDFKVDGPPHVEVTIEMCFKEGSLLSGAQKDENGNYFLTSGLGELSLGSDIIEFGPGKVEHNKIKNLDSEEYTYHQGSLRTNGVHVYLTGYTPFHHTMTMG